MTTAAAVQTQTKQRPWWLTLISGILAVVIGATLLWGNFTTRVEPYMFLVTFLGIWWMVQGIFDIIAIFIDHSMWGWKLFIGIVSIIAGGYILMYPVLVGLTLPQIFMLLLGIWGVIKGLVLLFLAFQGGGWPAGLMGAITIFFGVVLIINYGEVGWGLALVWVAAVFAFIGGFFMVYQAFKQRKA